LAPNHRPRWGDDAAGRAVLARARAIRYKPGIVAPVQHHAPPARRKLMAAFPPPTTSRPPITGQQFMVPAGHPLAAMAAIRILEAGGNAIDAGVAAGLCINVLLPDMTNLGGVAPIILYSAREARLATISG